MNDSTYELGSYWRHSKRPEWGLGRVVALEGEHVFLFFQKEESKSAAEARRARRFSTKFDGLTFVPDGHDPWLANLPPVVRDGQDYVLSTARLTFHEAIAIFLKLFPEGFGDPKFLAHERNYKVAAHEGYSASLGDGRLRALLASGEVAEAVKRVEKVIAATNLLHATEQIALFAALSQGAEASDFLHALDDFLSRGPRDREAFNRYLSAFESLPKMGKARVQTWLTFTVLPFLARPDWFISLKPTEARQAADALAYDIRYDPAPNWDTYQRFLDLSELLRGELEGLGCRDMIDVQSFIWAACGGYE